MPGERTIAVFDKDTQSTTEIQVDGHAVRRIVVESALPSGLPDELITALLPYIGLPAVRHQPVPAAIAAAPKKKSRKGQGVRYARPSDEALFEALEVVSPSPTILARHYGVPMNVMRNWLYTARKAKRDREEEQR